MYLYYHVKEIVSIFFLLLLDIIEIKFVLFFFAHKIQIWDYFFPFFIIISYYQDEASVSLLIKVKFAYVIIEVSWIRSP